MRARTMVCAAAAAVALALALGGCGIENIFNNAGHDQDDRPASKITGAVPADVTLDKLSLIDGDGNVVVPFQSTLVDGQFEMRLPSSKYAMLRLKTDIGNIELRSIAPGVNEESAIGGVDIDNRNMTETLITEARLSADGDTFKKVTPDAYQGTRELIRAGLDNPGPTQDLLNMVNAFMTRYDPESSQPDPSFFVRPVFCRPAIDETCTGVPILGDYVVKTSAIDPSYILRNPLDFVGDGRARIYSDDFDKKLAEVAMLYRPAGCPDPDRIRVVFTVDFNDGAKDGNCNTTNRFKWATDKPGKSMFFVGWIYDGSAGLDPSDVQDPNVAKLLGSSTPNTVPMYDDGTNGDQTAGDNIWSVTFDLPRGNPPDTVLRIGYKYTWGTAGSPWTGTEEWPGNSRILEVVDDNGDDFVYRHDVFGDEATDKDKSNAGSKSTLDWDTDMHGCGTPETHENKYDNNSCTCGSVLTPKWLGPLTVTCTQ